MNTPRTTDKTGRLDLAAVAIADVLAVSLCPREYAALRPHVVNAAKVLRPGRPGSITHTITNAVRMARRFA